MPVDIHNTDYAYMRTNNAIISNNQSKDLNRIMMFTLGVDRYVFFRADTDTDYYRSSRPITDILNRYTCLV